MAALQTELSDGQLTITINQPARRNAMSQQMWRDLQQALTRAQVDAAVHLVRISGAGEAFCAGADISEFDRIYASAASAEAANATIAAGLEALDALRKPSLAVIRGACNGGGCALAMACDFRLASTSARFGINPTALGLSYSFRDCQRLVHRIGLDRARTLLIGGQSIDATTAASWGLVSETLADDALEAAAQTLAESLRERSLSALMAVNANLNAIDGGQGTSDAELDALFADTFASADFRAATARFLNKG
ncbi:MAG: enoyl-CoA hydratase/isomerase family protein [Pseudomonadota bacterium]